MKFPFYKQYDAMDCGPTCLRMVAKFYGKSFKTETLREKAHITREGVSMLGISDAAEEIGFRSMGVKIGFEKLATEVPLPCIVHWRQNHFVVVYKIKRKGKSYKVYVSDPASGKLEYTQEEFEKTWYSTSENQEAKGVCLLLDPSPEFYMQEGEKLNKDRMSFLFKYLQPHRKLIVQLFLAFLAGSIVQVILPFLTQSIVDVGISNSNLKFIQLVLIGQLVLFASKTAVDFIRSWILLHISTRINISLISDFLAKLMRLPIGFFDSKMIGDLMQRIGDHKRIQNFLTTTSLNILFSIVNLFIFSLVLLYYDVRIFGIFFLGSILYVLYVTVFMKKRRELDHKRFAQLSGEQSKLIQLITGMQEIKLNQCETQKRWEWERIQANLFRVNMKSLALNQYQQSGSVFINEVKNLVITFFAATAVISGDITLGAMLAIQYIIGQMNGPIDQTIGFLRTWQDAKLSLERLGEIHMKEDEENKEIPKLDILPSDKSISLKNLSFQYDGPHSPKVLNDVNFNIPEGKVTAIVGTSGSGKTTLLKLILGFYNPIEGKIEIGEKVNLKNFSQKKWRSYCGSVMQDGFIFSDSIASNIALGAEKIDKKQLLHAAKTANILEHIESLPLSFNTKIGNEGIGLSQGQKQRILIARTVYKNPDYIFLDEATNALDANNEKEIMENLDNFFQGKTVVIIAHRLSTVKNADQIIVLEKGKLVEKGTHKSLTKLKGAYYQLVKNQLELGKLKMPEHTENKNLEEYKIDIHSQEVHEILSKPPHWLVRAGVVVMFLFIVLILIGSYFFKAPYTLKAKITISSSNPPSPIIAKTSGKIMQLFVEEQEKISKNEILGVLESDANFKDVLFLEQTLNAFSPDESEIELAKGLIKNNQLDLGTIQNSFSNLQSQLANYLNFKELNYHQNKIISIRKQIKQYEEFQTNLEIQIELWKQELKITKDQYNNDSILYTKGVISSTDWQASKIKYIQKKSAQRSAINNSINNSILMNQLDQQILDLELELKEQAAQKTVQIKESTNNLTAQISAWKKQYLFISEISGKVSYTRLWAENQYIKASDKVMTIIPEDHSTIIGRIELPIAGAGKVKVGHKVNIKLDNYPYMEYGILSTYVKSISLLADDNLYYLEVNFPDTLITNYGKILPLQQEMQGIAEIMTDDLRLIERLIYPVKSLIKEKVSISNNQ